VIDKAVLKKKLQELNRYLKELEGYKEFTQDELTTSIGKQWMVCHGLQLSIQSIIDIGNHLLAATGENQVEDYVDIIDRLGEKDIIPSEFARSIRGMVGLRNILVHEYARLDMEKVYYILQNRLNDFYSFINYINHYLKIEK
jgi:uncharacterized protein YutE (UPF0331/DUF86 family)